MLVVVCGIPGTGKTTPGMALTVWRLAASGGQESGALQSLWQV